MPDSTIRMGGGPSSMVPSVSGARKNGSGMRPSGGNRQSPQKVNKVPTDVMGKMVVVSDGPVVKENARVAPLSVDAEEFSLRAVPSGRVPTGEGHIFCIRITANSGGCRSSEMVMGCQYMLLGQFSVTFEYHPGAQHANADGMSRQCGQCMRPGCPVSSPHSRVDDGSAGSAVCIVGDG